MAQPETFEYWLRGPVEGIPALLQPVAHALLQAGDEIKEMTIDFPEEKLWVQPKGMASVGFHLQHIRGVLDRLFTYADQHPLTEAQLAALAAEGTAYATNENLPQLLQLLHAQIEISLNKLQQIDQQRLADVRTVGRAQLPSTLIGLLFHAAEHTMRHTGQLLVTIKAVL
jgi:uncharacterized damage-inducible protein DinB